MESRGYVKGNKIHWQKSTTQNAKICNKILQKMAGFRQKTAGFKHEKPRPVAPDLRQKRQIAKTDRLEYTWCCKKLILNCL